MSAVRRVPWRAITASHARATSSRSAGNGSVNATAAPTAATTAATSSGSGASVSTTKAEGTVVHAPKNLETIRVETVPQASNAAARLLELATRNADELVEEAKTEADRIIGGARATAERLGVADRVLAEIGAHGVVAGPDNSLQLQPANAVRAALAKSDVSLEDLRAIEVNEAFAAVGLASQRDLGLGNDVFNPNGGAIALGHPIGASGARLALTLVHELRRRGGGAGAAALCGGGGQGDALLLHV